MHFLLQECALAGIELMLGRKSLNIFTQIDHEIKRSWFVMRFVFECNGSLWRSEELESNYFCMIP